MSKLDLDREYDRRGTNSVKWDHKNFVDSRVSKTALPLWLSDMEFKIADEIIETLTKRVEHGFLGHSMPGDKYFEAIQGWYKRRFNWEIDKNSIFYSPGVLPALGFIIRAFTELGEGIIIQPPVFYPFSELIKGTGRVIVNNTLTKDDDGYSIDFEDLEKKVKDPKNTMLILCSPHNPVGRVWTKDELIKITEICRKNDVLIFSDELHCDLTRENSTHYPIKTLTDYNKIITAVALGKTFNVGGVPISQIIIDDNDLKLIWEKETMEKHYISFAPPLDIELTETAYNKCDYWVDEVMKYVESNFDFLVDYLDEHLPKVKYKKPEGTFLAWINLGAYVESEELFELLITKYDVLIENGRVFGESGDGYFRMTVACPRSVLQEGLDRIVKAIKELTEK
ncbi:MalY/PatB family protein [Fusibacter ferrireducens]|uniref:cysteine-S-conjugate beta-lyase n=1 Tax=Fusibacter ferrireducens TaxID=2785058 RepID=A0ABR9ZQQ8_9FIRM|nr:MalY/PatB family protein [Fusibacter ferrireducens]MBF4692265.1 pyridoxal phosphate-dependent aminotransferase [Fusibacter ferrireducens]